MGAKLYPIISRVAAAVLILAGGLKVHQVLTTSAPQPSAEMTMVQAVVELLLGAWLLAGFYPRWSRIAALVCFAVFLNAAVLQLLQHIPVCGCFGVVAVGSRNTVILDSLMMLALLIGPPLPVSTPPSWGGLIRAVLGSLTVLAILLLIGWQVVSLLDSSPKRPVPIARTGAATDLRPPFVERLVEKVGRNHAALRSLEYTLETTQTTYASAPKPAPDAGGKEEDGDKAKAVPRTHRLVTKSWMRGQDLRRDCDTRLPDLDAREVRVDAATRHILYEPGLRQAWLTFSWGSGLESIDLRCAGFHPPIQSIADWLKRAELEQWKVRHEGEAEEVVQLQFLADGLGGRKNKVTLDCAAARNYLPTRVVYRFDPGESLFSVTDLEYQKAGAAEAWVPKKWTYRAFTQGATTDADAKAGFDLIAETEVRSLSVNAEIGDDAFDPVLPPDTRLVGPLAARPRTGETPIRASEVILGKPIPAAAKAPRDVTPWLCLMGGIDAAALLLALLFRKSLTL